MEIAGRKFPLLKSAALRETRGKKKEKKGKRERERDGKKKAERRREMREKTDAVSRWR